jgi:ATP-dependent protease ClpP protease subunit
MEAHVFVYDDIGGSGVTLKKISDQLNGQKYDSVTVHIHSRGGYVDEGFAIYNYLRSLNKPITTVVEGTCYSIATVIALAGDTRIMMPDSKMMIHNPWGTIEGDADQIGSYAEMLNMEEKKIISFYKRFTDLKEDEIDSLMKSETYFDASKAVNVGFATQIGEERKAVAKLNDKKRMTENQDVVSALDRFGKMLTSIFKAQAKNMVEDTLADGTAFVVETEDGEWVGKVGKFAESGEPLPTGDHTLADGRIIVVGDGGVIESIKEADDTEALKTENEALKNELAKFKEDKEKMEAEQAEMTKNLQNIMSEFNTIKAKLKGNQSAPAKAAAAPSAKSEQMKGLDLVAKEFFG